MAYENIRFNYRHLIIRDSYFYKFDHVNDVLYRYIQDGRTAFSFPFISGVLDYEVRSAEYDGFHFWTLEDSGTYNIRIKKWYTEDNYCILEDTIDFIANTQHNYQSYAFAIEHYLNTLSTTVSAGAEYLVLDERINYLDAGDVLKLGPNVDGKHEYVTVTGTIGGYTVGINFFTEYTYVAGDKASCSKNIWMFNDYDGLVNTGALYKFKPNGTYITHYGDAEYKGVTSCTFGKVTKAAHIGRKNVLLYNKADVLKFLDVDSMSVLTSMVMDNLQSNGTTVIPIEDMSLVSNTLYRLQIRCIAPHPTTAATTDYAWGTYNYVKSPIRNFIDSISISAYPKILPANGVNTTFVTAIVKDQYGGPYGEGPVLFTDDDDIGYINEPLSYTWGDGIARVYYKAGLDVRTVNIEATAKGMA